MATHTITLTPTACTSPTGSWVVLYHYQTTNSSYYPRQFIFTYPANAELGGDGVNITKITLHGHVRNGNSSQKQLQAGFRTSDTAGVAEWASIDGANVLEGAFIAIEGWNKSGYGYAVISRSYSGSGVFAKWIKQQFKAGQPLYLGIIQPQSGKSISTSTTLANWTIDIEYELLGNIPSTDKTAVKLGETITTTVNRIISDSTTVLNYKIGDTVLETVELGTGTSHAFTAPLTAGSLFPSASSSTLTVEAVTSVSGEEYGTITTTATITLPDDCAPTVEASATRVWLESVPESAQIAAYVQRQSGAQIAVNGTGKYGASVILLGLTIDASTYTSDGDSATFTHLPFSASGTITGTITATDTRGNTGSATISIEVLPWSTPNIQAFTINRAYDTGAIAIDGTCAKADATASVSSLNVPGESFTLTGNPITLENACIGQDLTVSAEWTPKHNGSGDPSLTNILPISGMKLLTVTRQDSKVFSTEFSETIYGGSLDVDGNGSKTWSIDTLTGNETWHASSSTSGAYWAYPNNATDVIEPSSTNAKYELVCDRFIAGSMAEYKANVGYVTHDSTFCFHTEYATAAEWKAYLAEQYANGTPVQIAYKMKTAGSFTANVLTARNATSSDTFATNADTMTLSGSLNAEANTLKFCIQYREIGATDWASADAITGSGIASSISGLLASSGAIIDSFNDMTGYEFKLTVSDLYANAVSSDEMPTKEQFWDVDESSGKMGFGGDAPTSDESAGYRFFMPLDCTEGYKVYSTDEVDTGNKWIDGKTIYRACISTTTTIVGNQGIVGTLPSAVETPVSIRAFVQTSDGNTWRPVPNAYYGDTKWTVNLYINGASVYMGFGSYWTGTKAVIIIVEYTKGE